jgi:hypothetical protein
MLVALVAAGCSQEAGLVTPADSRLELAGGPNGAVKVTLYGPTEPGFTCATGANPVGETFGFAIMNTTQSGKLIANVQGRGLSPNATYDIYVNQDPGDCPTIPTGTFTTNAQGSGGANVQEVRVAGATNFWVSVVDQATQGAVELYRTPAATLN